MFEVARTASKLTNKVLVGLSGGKDSVATLDVCARFWLTGIRRRYSAM